MGIVDCVFHPVHNLVIVLTVKITNSVLRLKINSSCH